MNETAWDALQAAISELFGYRLLRPDTDGAHILADYVHEGREVRLDIASAGRGFQQVLLLLTLLNTRPGAVVLLDQPDAHLHPTLQDTIYRELRSAATRHGSHQLPPVYAAASIGRSATNSATKTSRAATTFACNASTVRSPAGDASAVKRATSRKVAAIAVRMQG